MANIMKNRKTEKAFISLIDESEISKDFAADLAPKISNILLDSSKKYPTENIPISGEKYTNEPIKEIKSDTLAISKILYALKLTNRQKVDALNNHIGITTDYHNHEIEAAQEKIKILESQENKTEKKDEESLKKLIKYNSQISAHKTAIVHTKKLANQLKKEVRSFKKGKCLSALKALESTPSKELKNKDYAFIYNKKVGNLQPYHMVCTEYNVSYDNYVKLTNHLTKLAMSQLDQTVEKFKEKADLKKEFSPEKIAIMKEELKEHMSIETAALLAAEITPKNKNGKIPDKDLKNALKSRNNLAIKDAKNKQEKLEVYYSKVSENPSIANYARAEMPMYFSKKLTQPLYDALHRTKFKKPLESPEKESKDLPRASWVKQGRADVAKVKVEEQAKVESATKKSEIDSPDSETARSRP